MVLIRPHTTMVWAFIRGSNWAPRLEDVFTAPKWLGSLKELLQNPAPPAQHFQNTQDQIVGFWVKCFQMSKKSEKSDLQPILGSRNHHFYTWLSTFSPWDPQNLPSSRVMYSPPCHASCVSWGWRPRLESLWEQPSSPRNQSPCMLAVWFLRQVLYIFKPIWTY